MTKLLVTSGHKTVNALIKIGYFIRDQEGSHIHLRHPTRKPGSVKNLTTESTEVV